MGVTLGIQGQVSGVITEQHAFHPYIVGRYFNLLAEDWSGIFAREWPKPAILPSPRGLNFVARELPAVRTATQARKEAALKPAPQVGTVPYVAKGNACAGQMPGIRQFVTDPALLKTG